MKRGAILLIAALLGACAQGPAARGGGIVSTNPCADAILVQLAGPERVSAVSHYSHDPGATSLPLAVARRYAATAGTAEEVIALRPALVLADSFAPATTLAAYRRAGLRVVVLDSPTTVAASIAQVRQVAAAVGEPAKGEAMVAGIERALISSPVRGAGPLAAGQGWRGRAASAADADSPRHRPLARPVPLPVNGDEPAPAALFYISGDLANGGGNLLDELMTRAGFRNAASSYGLSFTGTIPIETLVARPPAVIVSTGEGRSAALRRRLLPGVWEAAFPGTLINCGGPSIPAALARLRAIRAGL